MLRLNFIRLQCAFVLFIVTIVFLLIAGGDSSLSINIVERIFSLLFLITFTVVTPPLFISYLGQTHETFTERGSFFVIHLPIFILMYFFPAISCLIYVSVWLLFSIKLMPENKNTLFFMLFLFVLFFGSVFYLSGYLLNNSIFLKLYAKFLLSSYVSILCISGLLIFKKKVVKTLGPVLLIGIGQLFIVVFDIICTVV